MTQSVRSDDGFSDSELKFRALNMWANFVETGDVILSAKDAIQQGKMPRALELNQQKLVIRIRELAVKELTNPS